MQVLGILSAFTALAALSSQGLFAAYALRGLRSWRRFARARPQPAHWPRVHVLVCLKGALPRLEGTVRALDAQSYPGSYRVTFITEEGPERGEVAARELQRLLPGKVHCDHLIAGRVSQAGGRCAQKNWNLLAGIRHAEKGEAPAEVLAFCDGDLLAHPSWLQELVRPIAARCCEATTSLHLALANGRPLLGALHGIAEMCQSVASLVCRGVTWGGSMAIRASVFRREGLAQLWGHTAVDDVTLTRALRERRLRVIPVARFLVSSVSEIRSYGELVRWLGRQFFFVKVYMPSRYRMLWAMVALDAAAAALGLFHGISRVLTGQWPAGSWVGVSALLAAAVALGGCFLYRFLVPERPSWRVWLGAALLTPATSLLACAEAAARRRRLTWRDLTYELARDGSVLQIYEERPRRELQAPLEPEAPAARALPSAEEAMPEEAIA